MTTPQNATWKVTSVPPYTDFQTGGGIVEGHRVYFTTGNGAEGYVFIPQSILDNTAAVNSLVQAKANQLDNILGMINH